MIKFVHKKHFHKNRPEAKLVIYYNLSDIILGILLMCLTFFFAINYVRDHTGTPNRGVYIDEVGRY